MSIQQLGCIQTVQEALLLQNEGWQAACVEAVKSEADMDVSEGAISSIFQFASHEGPEGWVHLICEVSPLSGLGPEYLAKTALAVVKGNSGLKGAGQLREIADTLEPLDSRDKVVKFVGDLRTFAADIEQKESLQFTMETTLEDRMLAKQVLVEIDGMKNGWVARAGKLAQQAQSQAVRERLVSRVAREVLRGPESVENYRELAQIVAILPEGSLRAGIVKRLIPKAIEVEFEWDAYENWTFEELSLVDKAVEELLLLQELNDYESVS
ncbi:MAG: hypothetical protein S4CHLAM102_14950 [Chlamydiia bacterium]|nr:hypothetical protein [Chlamydiia bacterium]